MNDDSSHRRFGPIALAPGVKPAQIVVFAAVVVAAICMLNTIPLLKVYVFGEIMGIPRAEQGRLTGSLSTVQQIAVLVFITLTGAMADRLGRRAVLMMAMAGYIVTLVLYPLAGSIALLYGLHVVLGIASTGHTTGAGTMMADYPANASRGKFISMMLVLQSLASAVLVSWLGARIPGWLTATGMRPAEAGRDAFWAVAALGGAGLLAAALWMREPAPPAARQAATGKPGWKDGLRITWLNAGKVYVHARANPRFGLVMLMGCVIRSDYVVIGAFLSLWVMQGATAQGVSAAEALGVAGTLTAMLQIASVIAPPVFGLIADRVNRTVMLVVALALTGLALCSTLFIDNVLGVGIFVVVAAIGATEHGLIIAAQSVFGEEAPPDLRGSAQGLFAFMGTFSVVIVSFVSGYLFDQLGRVAPFVMVGSLNLCFAVLGLVLLLRQHRRGDAAAAVA